MSRLLFVEADHSTRETLALCLECEGFHPVFESWSGAFGRLDESFPLIVVDLRRAEQASVEAVRRLREHPGGRHALLLLLAEPADRVKAIELLARNVDAILLKPFGPREFVARAQSLLRRRDAGMARPGMPARDSHGGPLLLQDLEIDLLRRRARLRGRVLPLTEQEFQLLYFLATHPGRVFNRQDLLSAIWGTGTHVTLRSVDALVKRVRRCLGEEARERAHVQTVRGVGYRFKDLDPSTLSARRPAVR